MYVVYMVSNEYGAVSLHRTEQQAIDAAERLARAAGGWFDTNNRYGVWTVTARDSNNNLIRMWDISEMVVND